MNTPKSPCWMKCFFLLALLSSLTTVHGQTISSALVSANHLEVGQSVERPIKGGEIHLYQLTLATGEAARVELQSGKARFSLALLSETDELIAAISDADAPGLKRLTIAAERATNYLIRIAQEYGQAPVAQYRLTLLEKRAATDADRERFAAHLLSWEVVSLYRRQEKSALYQAADKARDAAARWQSLGDHEWAGRMFDRAGRSLFLLSEHRAGREVFQQAIAAFQKAGARLAETYSVANLGLLELADGEYRQAFSLAVRTLLSLQTTKDEETARSVRLLQAMHYRNIGEWKQAEALCRQLLPEAHTGRIDEWDRVYRDDVLMVLGMALAGQGQLPEGIRLLEEALALARPTSNQLNVVTILAQLGIAHRMAGQSVKAMESFAQCAAVSRRLGIRSYESQALSELGHLYRLAGRRTAARSALTRAVEAGIYGGKNYLSVALHQLAQLQHDEGQFTEALANVEQAMQIVEGLRVQLPMQDAARVTTGLLERDAYALRLDLLLHLHDRNRRAGYDALALQTSEFAHARSLVQLLSEQRQAGLAADDPALTTRLKELRQRIATLTNDQLRLRMSAAPGPLEAVRRDLATALAEVDRVILQMRDRNPHTAALTLPEPLKPGEIQKQILDRDTILLEYALGEERSFLFVVTPEALQVFNLPSRTVIEPVARQTYEALSRSRQPGVFKSLKEKQAWLQRVEKDYAQAATRLSALILKPAAALLGDRRLLIVPDGALHYVPFAALPKPEGGIRNSEFGSRKKESQRFASRKSSDFRIPNSEFLPLIADHEIISLPSASTLAVLRSEWAGRAPAPGTLMMFADPVFDQRDERFATLPHNQTAGAQPDSSGAPTALRERWRSFGEADHEGNFHLPRLPASRAEAEAILALVPPEERQAALDFEASYQAVTQRSLEQYRFVHFATHGLLDETHPELSGLLLSQVNRQGANVAGYLTTLDAFNLKLNAELVVLSGCRTALGKDVKGEGLVGLTRGFMYAGAKRVMASLWQVNDVATAELMQRFYQGLLGEKKLSPAAALRAAQLEMWQSKRWSAPYYWAAFVLQGEW